MDRGKEFEDMLGELYHRMGWKTQVRKRMKGRSGSEHEIDVYLSKGMLRKQRGAVEAKYKSNGAKVGKAEVGRFVFSLDDLGIKDAYFVTNSHFTSNAFLAARQYNVTCIGQERLGTLLDQYSMENRMRRIEEGERLPLSRALINVFDILGRYA